MVNHSTRVIQLNNNGWSLLEHFDSEVCILIYDPSLWMEKMRSRDENWFTQADHSLSECWSQAPTRMIGNLDRKHMAIPEWPLQSTNVLLINLLSGISIYWLSYSCEGVCGGQQTALRSGLSFHIYVSFRAKTQAIYQTWAAGTFTCWAVSRAPVQGLIVQNIQIVGNLHTATFLSPSLPLSFPPRPHAVIPTQDLMHTPDLTCIIM